MLHAHVVCLKADRKLQTETEWKKPYIFDIQEMLKIMNSTRILEFNTWKINFSVPLHSLQTEGSSPQAPSS